jgi:hypothetical protein
VVTGTAVLELVEGELLVVGAVFVVSVAVFDVSFFPCVPAIHVTRDETKLETLSTKDTSVVRIPATVEAVGVFNAFCTPSSTLGAMVAEEELVDSTGSEGSAEEPSSSAMLEES